MTQYEILDSMANPKPVMKISKEGIWVDPSLMIDVAAKSVLECLDTQIKNMVQMAVEAEREACAQLFDARDTGTGFYEPHEPAEMIRARGNKHDNTN
jgi:hypothetical protein